MVMVTKFPCKMAVFVCLSVFLDVGLPDGVKVSQDKFFVIEFFVEFLDYFAAQRQKTALQFFIIRQNAPLYQFIFLSLVKYILTLFPFIK